MCRSDPQILVDVTRTIASVASWIDGSGTVSTRTSRLPCQATAFIAVGEPSPNAPLLTALSATARPGHGACAPRHATVRERRIARGRGRDHCGAMVRNLLAPLAVALV